MSAGDNFFEDESLDSNSSESGDEGALAHTSNDHIYNRYFGSKAWKGSVEKGDDGGSHRRQNSESTATTPTRKSGFVGPSYDMLAPVVSVTHDFDSEIVSHQSIELARGWELGGWENSTFSDSLLSAMKNEENPDTAIFDYHSSALPRQGKMTASSCFANDSKSCSNNECHNRDPKDFQATNISIQQHLPKTGPCPGRSLILTLVSR